MFGSHCQIMNAYLLHPKKKKKVCHWCMLPALACAITIWVSTRCFEMSKSAELAMGGKRLANYDT